MIIPDKRKAVSVILARHNTDGVQDMAQMKSEHEINDGDANLKSIAEDMIRAFEQKSAHDLMRSLSAFISQSSDSDDEGE